MDILRISDGNRMAEVMRNAGESVWCVIDKLKSKIISVAKATKDKIASKIKSIDWKKVKEQAKESVKGVKDFIKNTGVLGYEKLKGFLLTTGIRLSYDELKDLEKIQELNSIEDSKIDSMPKDKVAEITEKVGNIKSLDQLYEKIMKNFESMGILPSQRMPSINSTQRVTTPLIIGTPGKFVNPANKPPTVQTSTQPSVYIPSGKYSEFQAFIDGYNAALRAMGKAPLVNVYQSGYADTIPNPQQQNTEEQVMDGTNLPKLEEEAPEEKIDLYGTLGKEESTEKKVSIVSTIMDKISTVSAEVRKRIINAIERGFTTVSITSESSKERTAEVTKKLTMEERIELQRSKNADKLEEFKNMRKQVVAINEEVKKRQEEELAEMDANVEAGPSLVMGGGGFTTVGSIWIFYGILACILEFGIILVYFMFN